MAIWSFADMSGVAPQLIRRSWNQTQRKIPTLRILSQIGAFKRADTVDVVRWAVKFGGQAAAAVNMDGGAFVTATSDEPVNANLTPGSYAAPVKVTDDMLWRLSAASGAGADINAALADPIRQGLLDAGAANLKLINQHIFQGSGAANQMTGAATSIAATGTYANINQATRAAWASQVTANGGVLQALTLGRVRTLMENVAINSNEGRPNLAICRPAVFSAWSALFEQFGQIVTTIDQASALPNRDRAQINPPIIRLPGGEVRSDGFRSMFWQNEGLYIVDDPDAVDTGATNVNNSIFFLNTDNVDVCYFEPPASMQRTVAHSRTTAMEQDMGDLANLPFDLAPRARIDYSDTWDLTAKVTVAFRSRNAHAKLQDQQ